MKSVVLLLAIIGLVAAQVTVWQGRVLIRNDPLVTGTLSGQYFYNFPTNRTALAYTIGVNEFYEYNPLFSVHYLVCTTNCQADTIQTSILRLFVEAGDTNTGTQVTVTDEKGNARTCTQYTKGNVPTNGISTISVDGAGLICQATFASGKELDFFNVVANVNGAPIRPTTCPAPVCTQKQDIVLVLDESGSIDPPSFQQERQFGIDFGHAFAFGPLATQMGVVQFDSTARLTILLTADQASYENQIAVITQNRQATCIGCGISLAQTEIFSVRGRPQALKVIVLLTDGQNNVNVAQFPAILANAKAAGIIFAAIGVARAVPAEIMNIASSPNLAFFATDFTTLHNVLQGLTTATCNTLAGSLCGPGCRGFCSCGQTCICPDICETGGNHCVNGLCVPGQAGNGCQFPPVVCNDNNLCTSDACVAPGGCVFTPINCNLGQFCSIDSCVPTVGCVHQARDCNPVPPNICFNYTCSNTLGCVNTTNPCNLCLNKPPCPVINCQVNLCVPQTGLCAATPKVCNSNSKCIIDGCDVNTGLCTQTPVNCNDNNACTVDTCDPVQGCMHTPIDIPTVCNDSSVCTIKTCDPAVGCVRTPIVCNRTSICTQSICNSILGCQESAVDCGIVLSAIDKNKQGNCYVANCNPNKPNPLNPSNGCFLDQIPGTHVDQCGYCAAPGQNSPFCFLGLNAPVAAGLGAGVIAAIVIGAVVAAVIAVISGKKGYDVWVKHRNNMQGAQANPMYEDSGRSGNNPFFEAKA